MAITGTGRERADVDGQSGASQAAAMRAEDGNGRRRATGEEARADSAGMHHVFAASSDRANLRILEALLFASAEPLAERALAEHIKLPAHSANGDADDHGGGHPGGHAGGHLGSPAAASGGPAQHSPNTDEHPTANGDNKGDEEEARLALVRRLLEELKADYAARGVNLVRVAGKWAFRTAPDLGYLMKREVVVTRRLSRAALETLAIIAYHQPVTRAEIEEVRGVATSKGTLDVLLETGWVRLRGRRRAPGRPVTYGTTEAFLDHFGLESIRDLPGLAELKGAGLLDANLPPDFEVPEPQMLAALMPDELPLDAADDDEAGDDEAGEDETEVDEGDRADERAHNNRDDGACEEDSRGEGHGSDAVGDAGLATVCEATTSRKAAFSPGAEGRRQGAAEG